MKKLITIIIVLLSIELSNATQFDELDKPPEGAHEGQMLLGAFISIGSSKGNIINAEHKFLKGSTYTFLGNATTKELIVNHLTFGFGLGFEYMPIDYLGIKTKIKRTAIVQRTHFGSQYENWNRSLYTDFSFYLGPSIHLTTRKQWDFTLTPVFGYAIGKFTATPIAAKLLAINGYYGSMKRSPNNLTFGSELNFTFYFSGGLFISVGFDWTMNMIKFNKFFYLRNPQTTMYYRVANSSNLYTYSFILSAGYAFSN